MATRRKMRKFVEGGSSIDEDVRARAMKFVEDASEESRNVGTPVTRAASKSTSSVSKTVAPPAKSSAPAKSPAPAMPAEEKERMESLVKKQALERVSPEDYLLPGGALKGALKGVVRAGEKKLAKSEANRKTSEGFSPTEALAAREKVKTDELIKKAQKQTRIPKNISKAEQEARKERYLSTGPMEDAFGTGSQFKRGFKSGGSVKMSASKRADGCAIRGKTRA